MATKGLQRTLLLGLGQLGSQTADQLLTELRHQLGSVPLIQGLAVLTKEIPLQTIQMPVLISGQTAFENWPVSFAPQVKAALYQISQLDNLSQLARQNLTLRRPDEIHLIVLANLLEA